MSETIFNEAVDQIRATFDDFQNALEVAGVEHAAAVTDAAQQAAMLRFRALNRESRLVRSVKPPARKR